MEKSSSASGSGVGFCGLLTVLFIGLKLTGYIDWSWLWVLAPLWAVPLGCIIVIAVVVFVVFTGAFVTRLVGWGK